MRELRTLVRAARSLREAREPFLVTTVVGVEGSSYRGLGARMLSTEERWVAGSVSGGCLERDILRRGMWRTREQRAVLVTHDGLDEDQVGTGCQGKVDLLIERQQPADSAQTALDARHAATDPLSLAHHCLREESLVAVATVLQSSRPGVQAADRMACLGTEQIATFDELALQRELHASLLRAREQGGRGELVEPWVSARGDISALIEVIAPPPHLFVFGTAHDAAALVSLARSLAMSITVWCEQAPDAAVRERFAHFSDCPDEERLLVGPVHEAVRALERCIRPLAIVMGHHYERDRAVVGALASAAARYVGVLGPRQRTQRILEDLAQSGQLTTSATESLAARLHAPAGLDLGARTPHEIALSILAEAQAVLHGASTKALRTKALPIHA